MIELQDRILLSNGTSIVTDDFALSYVLEHGEIPEWMKVASSDDASRYDYVYGTNISIEEIDDKRPAPVYDTQQFDWDDLILRLSMDDRIATDKHRERFNKELDFFEQNNLMPFLMNLDRLIAEFKRDGVVWGVGRGSSCASLVLYLLDLHCVDPVKYRIDFKEFSKQKEDEDECDD